MCKWNRNSLHRSSLRINRFYRQPLRYCRYYRSVEDKIWHWMISRKDDTPFSFGSKGQYLANFTSFKKKMCERKERKKEDRIKGRKAGRQIYCFCVLKIRIPYVSLYTLWSFSFCITMMQKGRDYPPLPLSHTHTIFFHVENYKDYKLLSPILFASSPQHQING